MEHPFDRFRPDAGGFLRLCGFLAWLMCAGLTHEASAQLTTAPLVSSLDLPEAPGMGSHADTRDPLTTSQRGSASIAGTVVDTTGAVVPGARVTLDGPAGIVEIVVLSDADGTFSFTDLGPGHFRVTVTSARLGAYVSPEITLAASERYELEHVVLPITAMNADVLVVVNDEQIATEQIELQEKQRVLGILPNFYTSYVWNAAPLTARLKFGLAFKAITDPVAFLGAGALAGIQQANDTFPAYGQGARGYGKRFGAAYADDAIARMLGSAILPSVLHQDPRYFYRGSGGLRKRALYALAATVICKGDSGHWQPNYSYLLGSFGSGGIANLYHPARDRGAGLTIRNGLIDTAGHAGNQLMREFLLRRLTPKVPDYANGKP